MPRRKPPPRLLSEEERHLWQQAVEEVRPLEGYLSLRRPVVTVTPPVTALPPAAMPSQAPVHVRPRMPALPSPMLDPQMKRRMKRGALAIEARLDLHGMSEEAAYRQLAQFLEYCHRADRRFVLVITGKGPGGRGTLRENLPRWLELAPLSRLVQAFEPAQPRDGGGGAFYVKLRRPQE